MLLNLSTCTGKLKISPLHQPLYDGRNIHLVPVYFILILKLADTSDVPGSFCGLRSIFWIGPTLYMHPRSFRATETDSLTDSCCPAVQNRRWTPHQGGEMGPWRWKSSSFFPGSRLKDRLIEHLLTWPPLIVARPHYDVWYNSYDKESKVQDCVHYRLSHLKSKYWTRWLANSNVEFYV